MSYLHTKAVFFAAAFALFLVPAAASAQDYSSDEIAAFADALVEVQTVQAETQPRVQQAESAEKRAQIQQDAQEKMVQAIEDQGLSVEEYQEMSQAVRQDDEFWSKVQEHMAN